MIRSLLAALSAASLLGSTAFAQAPAAAPPPVKGDRNQPDTPGTGPYPALKEELASLPDHVVYRPADLAKLGTEKLGIVAWGNGGCSDDGAHTRLHLLELASHGFLVIASGTIQSGPGFPPQPMPTNGAPPPGPMPPPKTNAKMLVDAINWAVAENGRAGSPFRGRLDAKAIAVAGFSCGGVQALEVATSDLRVKTSVIMNSGVLPTPSVGMSVRKEALDRLRAPILYILGGKSDIAYANGMDDFRRITKVPVAVANLGNVGHGGTYFEANGGKAAQAAAAWLRWQLKGDAAAAKMFTGADCGLCRDPDWLIERKGIN